MKIEIDGR